MPPKKTSAAMNKKGISEKGKIKELMEQPTVKVEKIAFSFTATANLNDGGEIAGNVPYLWASKNSMIRCALTYGDTVIVQTINEDKKLLASKTFSMLSLFSCFYSIDEGTKGNGSSVFRVSLSVSFSINGCDTSYCVSSGAQLNCLRCKSSIYFCRL